MPFPEASPAPHPPSHPLPPLPHGAPSPPTSGAAPAAGAHKKTGPRRVGLHPPAPGHGVRGPALHDGLLRRGACVRACVVRMCVCGWCVRVCVCVWRGGWVCVCVGGWAGGWVQLPSPIPFPQAPWLLTRSHAPEYYPRGALLCPSSVWVLFLDFLFYESAPSRGPNQLPLIRLHYAPVPDVE